MLNRKEHFMMTVVLFVESFTLEHISTGECKDVRASVLHERNSGDVWSGIGSTAM